MKKLPAFSMMELMITMLLSSIFFSLGYLCYDMTLKQFSSFRNKNREISDVVSFFSALNGDVTRCSTIKKKDSNSWYFENPDKKTISYSQTGNRVLRTVNNITDTFFLPVKSFSMFYQEQAEIKNDGLVEKITIYTLIGATDRALTFKKEYGSEELINQERIAEDGN